MKKVHDLLRRFRKGKGIQPIILGLKGDDSARIDFLNSLTQGELKVFKDKCEDWKGSNCNLGLISDLYFLEMDLSKRIEGQKLQPRRKRRHPLTQKEQEDILDAWHNCDN